MPERLCQGGDGYAGIRGASIAGQRVASMARGRDLAGRIASFTDDHGMIVIYGWRATEVGAKRSCAQDHLTQERVMGYVSDYADLGIARLAMKADLSRTFAGSRSAQTIWNRHLRQRLAQAEDDPPIPQSAVRLYERPGCPVGLVIDGHWERGLGNWDLSCPATILLSTGKITTTPGCVAEGLEEL
ncbi:hypothetical protein [Komagataeibacter europaeus]|uniref:hypothetical protein n=1 Tax=Komagataeibacter europaeus TaxID=33995 RepID=UPI00035CFEB8|nr:hypothetical protein [Komagataeibacter europaeus]GBQ40871.1 hypothetical protein AA18890_0960 [Komagataeibacter europaeus LMG 18890]